MDRALRVSTGRPVVIDSSVAFKWFDTTEAGADIAEELLDAHGRDEIALVAPAHFPIEILNVHSSRGASVDMMTAAIQALADADLIIAPVDDELLIDATRIACAERISVYDAVFIALAAHIDAELVTADRRQATTRSCRVRLIGSEERG